MNNVITIDNGRLASLSCDDWFAYLTSAEGHEGIEPLPYPNSFDGAAQCREMGLSVGDVIVGREAGKTWWNESELTLLWCGDRIAVWGVRRRSDWQPDWKADGEAANWTLSSRKWFRVLAKRLR